MYTIQIHGVVLFVFISMYKPQNYQQKKEPRGIVYDTGIMCLFKWVKYYDCKNYFCSIAQYFNV